ncbi:hypothetical protein PM082_024858 [Marasmius tenuissimus]|nr:hypothetical protein PM082_024858 [Marasmius tenuissimus]
MSHIIRKPLKPPSVATKTRNPHRKCRFQSIQTPKPPPVVMKTRKTKRHRQLRSIQTQYRSRRQRRPSANDTMGDVYMLLGRYKGKTFLKVGRSVDSERRFEQHRRTCKRVDWTRIGSWPMLNCHKAGASSSLFSKFLPTWHPRALYTPEDGVLRVHEDGGHLLLVEKEKKNNAGYALAAESPIVNEYVVLARNRPNPSIVECGLSQLVYSLKVDVEVPLSTV